MILATTGGFLLRLGSLRLSSRNPSTAVAIAIVSALLLIALRWRASPTTWQDEWRWWQARLLATPRPLRALLVPAVTIGLIAAGLEVVLWLRAPPLWGDEEMIALNIRDRSFFELPGALWLGQSAPLGWLVVQRTILLILGPAEVALRLVPLLFGIGTIAGAVWVGQRWMNRLGAAVLVLLCGFGPWLSFFPFELKHYSADAFWGLLLPAVGAWAIASDDAGAGIRRWTIWWIVAAAGLWFGNGALLVTPACAIVLMAAIWQCNGVRSAARFAVSGLIWVASAGAHYWLALEAAHRSRYLRTYWADSVPPEALGLFSSVAWVAERLDQVALNPAGSSLAAGFWIAVACGFAVTPNRVLGALFATVPLSAFALASLRLMPMHERLALWIVPALYVGIALLVDRGGALALEAWRLRRPLRLVPAALCLGAALVVTANITAKGTPLLDFAPRRTNHGLDDRAAVRWLMQQRQPGDVLLTTRLGWPAVWWYGPLSLRNFPSDGRLADGTLMYEVFQAPTSRECERRLRDGLNGHARVLVHVGFPDMPPGFYDRLLREIAPIGTVVQSRAFADSRTAVIHLRELAPASDGAVRPTEDCVGVGPARLW